MVKDYNDWLKVVMNEDNPDGYVLRTFYEVIEQYFNSPDSKACKGVIDSAMGCVKKYLS